MTVGTEATGSARMALQRMPWLALKLVVASTRAEPLGTSAGRFRLKRLGEISRVLGDCPDLKGLEHRIESLNQGERGALSKAIEAQRSQFLSDGSFPSLGGSRSLIP